jgi:two-component system, NtrC family, sensor histidine kinase KinB
LGLKRDEIIGKRLPDWLRVMNLAESRLGEIMRKLEEEGGFFQEEVELQCPNGCEEKCLLLSVNFLMDDARNRTGFQAVLEDMTQRRMLEEKLSAERNQMNAVFDSSPTGFIFVDSHRVIQRINTEACRLLGYPPPEQIVNTDMNAFRQEAQKSYKDPKKFMKVLKELYEDPGNSAVGIWELTLPTRWVRYYVSPVHDNRGQPIGWLWILNDMTDRIARDQLRNDLTHMIVHDLKNPLTAIQGGVYVMKNLLAEKEPVALRALDVIGRNATRMQRMVMNLLDIERLEQGKLELATHDIRLKEMLETIIEGQRPAAGERDVELQYDPYLPAVPIKADDNLLERVITNLLSNAIKHTRPNGKIVIKAEGDARGYLTIRVTDDGDGIDPKYHKKIFERFGQAELRRDGHGVDTGLGLTFCKLAVEAHQGRISVESEPGKGATFMVQLPGLLAPAPTEDATAASI